MAQVIDLAHYEHLPITEAKMGKGGLLLVKTSENKLMMYTNEQSGLKRNFLHFEINLE